jgi:tetratricopeptide (TPR) repeat protein
VTGSGPIVAALYYAGTLVPALGLFNVYPMRFSFVANHFAYLATIGPIALAASAGVQAAARLARAPREALRVGAVFLILTLAVLANRESRNYRDLQTLWTRTIARNPGCWICEVNLGSYLLFDLGEISESIQHSERALVLKPDSMEAMINVGMGNLFQGHIDEAVTRFRAVLARYPTAPNAHAGLGNALLLRGEPQEAIAHLEEAVRIAPGIPYTRYSLGVALTGQGRTDEAIAQLEQAVRLRPNYTAAREALANARGQAERRAGAPSLRLTP